MSYTDILKAQLVIDEGDRDFPYKDTVNNLSIGIGRNLTSVGISQDEKELMLANDVGRAEVAAVNIFPAFYSLSDNRKAALANLAFNMGQATLATFTGFVGLVNAGSWDAAADDLLGTKYAQEVGARAQRIAALLRSG